jgi:ribonuclease HII
MAKILGMDEAGRGPVIGPMVMAAVMMDEDKLPELKKYPIKDSKLLSPKQREELYNIIAEMPFLKYEIKVLSPKDIDNVLESENFNLNWLEAITSAMLINKLKPDKAILDCPSPNTKAYTEYIKKNLLGECKIIAEHKADLNYPIVSAASILAKVTRDREIKRIQEDMGEDFGSGYPSDPKTVEFLKANVHNPKIQEYIRKGWQSYKRIVEENKQKKLGDY